MLKQVKTQKTYTLLLLQKFIVDLHNTDHRKITTEVPTNVKHPARNIAENA